MDWTKLQNKAADKIAKYGQAMRLVIGSSSPGTYNALTDSYASAATTGYDIYAMYTVMKSKDDNSVKEEQAALMFAGKDLPRIDLLTNVQAVAPDRTMQLRNISALQPGGTVLIYKANIFPSGGSFSADAGSAN